MSLREYARKRHFDKTSEPDPQTAVPESSKSRFVIQKHAASRLHYDFRLEMDGALKSWAVPKGIPLKKGEKRLAVHVEDHPVAYIDFEGTIPKGQYGGGTVMVWDSGTYELSEKYPRKTLDSGQLHFTLRGKKLNGDWGLVRMQDDQWLLMKHEADAAEISKKLDDTSSQSGKSMKEIEKTDRVWESKPAGKPAVLPAFVAPMSAKSINKIQRGPWIYEVKLDGYRAIALKAGSEARLLSRNENDLGKKFGTIVDAIRAVGANELILDGEVVALDEAGKPSFQLLQAFELGEKRPPIFYYTFDLLRLNGRDLRNEPLTHRKELLEEVIKEVPDPIRFAVSLEGDPDEILRKVKAFGLEGVIGKKIDSLYESGVRSGAWVKIRLVNEQEFVIGGFTLPSGSRSHFGALLVGYYENKDLLFAGKVGSGYSEQMLDELAKCFESLARKDCPFVNLPESQRSRWGQAITRAELKRCRWLTPELICQVRFTEWTRDGKLRQPVFLGLREDKSASEVVREVSPAS